MGKLVGFWIMIYILFVLKKWDVRGFGFDNSSNSPDAVSFWESMSMSESAYGVSATAAPATNNALMVGLTLVQGAAAEGAVCLDGSSPGYHLHRGSGKGTDNWLIHLEGGGWCNNIGSCKYRAKTFRGSSNKFEKSIPFTGILSNKSNENPDFFNWNKVKIRYCDGASFSGDSENKDEKLHFRGRRIWKATMKELLSKGMKNAKQTLLSGCSAGGLASILHCDKFRNLFPKTTRVKCLSDAGLFLDAADVSGGRTLRRFFRGVVRLQGVERNLTGSCPKNLTRTSCFFPQNLIAHIKTPLFILNAAYDSWQVQQSLAPETADPNGKWQNCKMNIAECSVSQKRILQGFRNQMVNATKDFTALRRSGLFLDSCFAHCQSERQGTWFDHGSPTINKKSIAVAVGDWYFDRKNINEAIDREDCSSTCHNLVFN